jgi:Tol biopolymer transport system component
MRRMRNGAGLRPGSGGGRLIAGVGVVAIALGGWASAAAADSAWVTRASESASAQPADYTTPSFSPPAISDDGRYVAFDSFASNLAAGAVDGGVFVRDTRARTTAAASVRANGTVDDLADSPAISGDGRFVAFVSDDKDIVPGGNDNYFQVFLRDRTTGVTTRVSTKTNGNQASDESGLPSLSGDGRYIAFESDSPGLVAGDTNDWTDAFVRDRVTNTTKRVSLTSTGAEADVGGGEPSISTNGQVVAFSSSDLLTPADTNIVGDIYVRSTAANTTTLVSLATNGTIANGASSAPRISGNGRVVAFTSMATNLDGIVDTNDATDVFVRDLVAGTTQRVSVSSTGGLALGAASHPTISSNGRFITYESTAANAVVGDTNGVADVFVFDRNNGQTSRVSTDQSGTQLPLGGTRPVISADGRIVAFATASPITGLAPAAFGQLYVRLRAPALTADAPPEISIGNASVVEGDLRARQLRFTVSLSRASTAPVSMAFGTLAGTATAGTDFVAKLGTLTIPAGALAGQITVDVKGDRQVEAQEAFRVQLVGPVGASLRRSIGTGTIVTDDNPSNAAVRVSIGNAALVEGDTGARGLRFPVTLSASSPTATTVRYTTAPGTAGAADFAAKSGTVTIPARATSAVINIAIRPDFVFEATEAFIVRLSAPVGATLNRATGTGSILDDG